MDEFVKIQTIISQARDSSSPESRRVRNVRCQFLVHRTELLSNWVKARFPHPHPVIEPASADASFRRYFRLRFVGGAPARIVMDAPPDKEDSRPFVAVCALLDCAGINVPRVIEADLENGFLLLADLGTQTYLSALCADKSVADALYRDAIDTLVRMQVGASAQGLAIYDRELLLRELELLPEWYIARHRAFELDARQRAALGRTFETLIANNLAQSRVFVHRDYHTRNLMVCAPADGTGANPGVLDFQDAVLGPITYDLVSLLKDAYVEWDEERVLDWAIRYWELARRAGLPVNSEFGEFYRDFEWMGLQRHLKVLGIFARLDQRNGKAQYLADLPQVMRYVRKTCERYSAFTPLLRILDAVEKTEVRPGYTF